MRLRLTVLSGFLVTLTLSILYLGNWIGPSASSIKTVTHASFAWRGPSSQTTQAKMVALPHSWNQSDFLAEVLGIYHVTLPRHDEHESLAISVANYMPKTEIQLDGKLLPWTRLTGNIGQVAFTSIGTIAPGQSIEFRVPQHYGMRGGLGEIYVGPEKALLQRAWVISILRDVAYLWVIGMTMAVGFVSFGMFWFRRSPFLLVLAYAALAGSTRFALPYIFGYWSDDGIELALYQFLGASMAISVAFLVMRASGHSSTLHVGVIMFCVGLIAALLFSQTGSLAFRRGISIGLPLLLFGYVLLLSWQTLLRKRYSLLLAVLTLILIRSVMIVVAALENEGLLSYYDLNNQTKVTPLLIVVGALIATRYISEAFRTFELTNGRLHQEVDTYKAKLAVISERERVRAIEQAAANERSHWMQEIHDGLGSHLIAARFIADKASDVNDLQRVKNSIDDGIEELRELVDALSPGQTTVPSILGAMRYRMNSRFESAGVQMRWEVDPKIEAKEIGATDALNVQRITQEALTNILKHSQAQTVSIHIFTLGGYIVVRIDDDGIGFKPDERTSGRGLSNMRERARRCQGEILWITMTPGTRVELRLPNS